ncbi:MAG: hypothetical protein ACW967_04160 [Candidatus Hodarchaeales archaeon]
MSAITDDTFLDNDFDAMPNVWEYQMGLNLLQNDTELDFDEDGMSNIWEYNNNFNASFNDAYEDPDGDWMINIGEYRHGSNPHDFWSVPLISSFFPFISAVHFMFFLEVVFMAVIRIALAVLFINYQKKQFTNRLKAQIMQQL